jgi:hypothetical protein
MIRYIIKVLLLYYCMVFKIYIDYNYTGLSTQQFRREFHQFQLFGYP